MTSKRSNRARVLLCGMMAAWACIQLVSAPVLAAHGPQEAVERLRAQIPALDRIDAATDYVRRTAQGEKTGYIVMFKTGSIADPTAKGRAERAMRAKNAVAEEMPAESGKLKVLSEAGIRRADAKERYNQLPLTYVEVSSAAELNSLLAHSEIESLEANRMLYPMQAIPSNLDLIKWPSVQAFGNLGAETSVAVLDTGVCYKNTSPSPGYCASVNSTAIQSAFGICDAPGSGNCKIALARDFAADDGQLDDSGHGTNVAAIVTTVAPGAKLLSLDVFNGSLAQLNDVLAAMNFVIDTQRTQPTLYNIVAMNLSLGETVPSQYSSTQVSTGAYKAAVDSALQYGIATIVAAGNESSQNGLNRPANTLGAISVGAVYNDDSTRDASDTCYGGATAKDKPVCVSNFATYLTMLAPGKPVTAGGLTASGTSQAAPHVVGAYAALRAQFPAEDHNSLMARLTGAGNSVAVTDSRSYAANRVFPRLDLWRAMGSCTYSQYPSSINLLNGGGARSFTLRTSASHCPLGASVSAPWLTQVTATQDGVDRTLWTVSYVVDPYPAGADRLAMLDLKVAAEVLPVTITIAQSSSAGNQRVSLNPSSVSFGEQQVSGVPSPPAVVSIRNSGTTNPLVVSNICIASAGNDACAVCGGYSVTSSCIGQDIAPGSTCALSVRFNPTATGVVANTCRLKVETNDPIAPAVFASLGGNGIAITGGDRFANFGIGGKDSSTSPPNGALADIVAASDGNFLAAGKGPTNGMGQAGPLVAQYYGDNSKTIPALSFPSVSPIPGTETGVYAAVAVRRTSDSSKAIVTGNFGNSLGQKKAFVARFNLTGGAAGSLDPTFGAPYGVIVSSFGVGSGTDAAVQAAELSTPGDILYLRINCFVVKLDANGNQDSAYGSAGKAALANCDPGKPGSIAVLQDGALLYATSSVGTSNGEKGLGIGKLLPNGLPDSTFGKNGVANGRAVPGAQEGYATDFAVFKNGNILAVGPIWEAFASSSSPFAAWVVKFTPNGLAETGFGTDGARELVPKTTSPRFFPGAVRVLETGQFAVLRKQTPAGVDETASNSFSILYRLADGSPDGSFTGDAKQQVVDDDNFGPGTLSSNLGSGRAFVLGDDGGPVVAYDNGIGGGVVRYTPPLLSGNSVEGVIVRVTGSQSSANASVTIANGGSTAVTGLNNLAAYSVSNGDFTVTSTNCPASLPNSGSNSCSVSVSVVRGIVGLRAAVLTATGQDLAGNPVIFQIALEAVVTATTTNRLTIGKFGTGVGRVRSAPSGIDCGTACQVDVAADGSPNQIVTLAATPDDNSTFSGWSGACAGTGTCVVTVSQQRNVTATFAIKPGSIPANDSFSNRRPLNGSLVTDPPCAAMPAPPRASNCGVLSRISNVGAGKDAGEPDHAGNGGGRSLWWTWTAPSTGDVTIDTNGSTFDTVLAAYTGNSVNALSAVASADDGGEFFRSKLTFKATRGQTYQIAVDGYNGATGEVVLNVYQPIYMYMTGTSANILYALDTVKNIFTPANFANPYYMDGNVAVNNAGDRLYVTNYYADTVSVIDAKTGQMVPGSPFATGSRPEGVAINSLDNRFYVVNFAANTVSVFDAITNAKITDVDVGPGMLPSQVAVHPSGKAVYVTLNNTAQVGVIDAATNKLVTRIGVGPNPYNLVFDPVRPLLYVANNQLNTISVIDTTSNTTVDEIRARVAQPNDFNSLQGLAVNPAGTRLFTGNILTATLSVVDLSTRKIVKTVSIGAQAVGVAVSLDGKTLYTTNRNSNSVHIFRVSDIEDNAKCPDGGTCAPIETKTGVTGAWATNSFLYSGGFPIPSTPVNDAFEARKSLTGGYAVDTSNNTLATSQLAEPNHDGNPPGRSLWWTWTAPVSGRVTVDTFGSAMNTVVGVYSGSALNALAPAPNIVRSTINASGIVTGKLDFDAQAGQTYQIAVDGKNGVQGRVVLSVWQPLPAYATSQSDRTVTAFDTVTNTILTVRPSGVMPASSDATSPYGGVVSPDGKRIYLSNYGSGTLSVLDRASTLPLAIIGIGGQPLGIAVSPDSSRVLVGDAASNVVKLIDAQSNTVLQTIAVGMSPAGIVFVPDGTRAYVANYASSSVSVIDLSSAGSPTITTLSGVGSAPYGIAVSPTGSYVAVVDFGNLTGVNGLTIINTQNNSKSTFNTQMRPAGVAFSPTGTHLLVTNTSSNSISVYSVSPLDFVKDSAGQQLHVPLAGYPFGVSFTPDGKYAYVVTNSGNGISAMRMTDYKIVGTYGIVNSATSLGNFVYQEAGLAGLPAAPVISSLVSGSGQLTVNFVPGASNGSPIGSFTAVAVAPDNSRYFGSCVAPCTSIVIAGLTSGTIYNVTMIATNGIGDSAASSSVNGTPAGGGGGGLTLSSVVSRKTHGAAGDFSVSIDPTKLISGAIDVEPRNIGTGHRIVFTFNQAVNSIGTVTALDAMNMPVGSVASSYGGTTVTVLLTNVPDGKRVTITIPNINGSGNGSASLGFLVGDVNSTGIVTAADISGIKAHSGQATVLTNARYDINLSGNIEATDVSAVKARAGNRLP